VEVINCLEVELSCLTKSVEEAPLAIKGYQCYVVQSVKHILGMLRMDITHLHTWIQDLEVKQMCHITPTQTTQMT
jgi:hypothetical protein